MYQTSTCQDRREDVLLTGQSPMMFVSSLRGSIEPLARPRGWPPGIRRSTSQPITSQWAHHIS